MFSFISNHSGDFNLRGGTSGGGWGNDEGGDTLIEILIALTIVGLAAVALITAFLVSFSGAATYRKVTTLEFSLKNFAETATYQIQQAPLASSTAPSQATFTSCAAVGVSPDGSTVYYGTSSAVSTDSSSAAIPISLPSGYIWTSASILYWEGSGQGSNAFGGSCTVPLGPQQITVALRAANGASDTLTFVVTDPNYENSLVP